MARLISWRPLFPTLDGFASVASLFHGIGNLCKIPADRCNSLQILQTFSPPLLLQKVVNVVRRLQIQTLVIRLLDSIKHGGQEENANVDIIKQEENNQILNLFWGHIIKQEMILIYAVDYTFKQQDNN
ncbi:hypothetical protein LXL04_024258 [Taraxacum kok-saghyz]